MKTPDLAALTRWIGPDLRAGLDERRKDRQEYHRPRKLATTQTLWLMLAVSLDTVRSSLYEILQLAVADLPLEWSELDREILVHLKSGERLEGRFLGLEATGIQLREGNLQRSYRRRWSMRPGWDSRALCRTGLAGL